MTPKPDQPHAVRRVVLPSGKTIEVVYFADDQPGAVLPPEARRPVEALHHCGQCQSDLVYPTWWEEAGDDAWQLQLRCPNCEWVGEGVYQQPVVESLDEELDRGTHVLLRDLKQLMQANMEEDVERFIAALRDDHVWPIDF